MHEYRDSRREQRAASRSHEHRAAEAAALAAGGVHEYRRAEVAAAASHEYRAAGESRLAAPAHEYRRAARPARAGNEGRVSEDLALSAWHEYRIVPHEYRIVAHEYRIAASASFAGQAQASMDLGSGSLRAGDDWRPIFESTEDQRVTIELFPVRGVTVDVLAAKRSAVRLRSSSPSGIK